MLLILSILLYLLMILGWLVLAQCILSLLFAFNVLNYSNSGLRAVSLSLDKMMRPLYRPFRRILPDTGNIDWSPFALLVTIGILRIVLQHIAAGV